MRVPADIFRAAAIGRWPPRNGVCMPLGVTVIDIQDLQLTIDEKEILQGIDLHLKPGDIYGLLGPNGAGKSSTILAILGLRQRSGGQIKVLGFDPNGQADEIRRSIGVIPEKAGFYDWMTAMGYLRWFARLYAHSRADEDLRGLLRKVGLAAESDRRVATFSRGMRQRLAVARALIPNPDLFILDEPTNGLDPAGRREIHDLLLEFVAEKKKAVLLCTHLLDDVDRLCNRIGIIDRGRTRTEGVLNDLLARQSSARRFRLRLEDNPPRTTLPDGVSLIDSNNGWWKIQIHSETAGPPSGIWGELERCGWHILEIRCESSSLEELYLNNTVK
jgi:ABC-2 type transport system ATP-binding protein